MTPRLFRPATPRSHALLPQLDKRRGVLAVAVDRVLTLLWSICQSPRARRTANLAVVLVGLVVQGVLLLTVAYLCDLSISLMELWAELARKHLELTL